MKRRFWTVAILSLPLIAYMWHILPEETVTGWAWTWDDQQSRPTSTLCKDSVAMLCGGAWLAIVALVGFGLYLAKRVDRIPNWLLNLPNRDHWLAEERQDETRRRLAEYWHRIGFAFFACQIVCFALITMANQTVPPRLNLPVFLGTLIGTWAYLVAISYLLYRRFKKVDATKTD